MLASVELQSGFGCNARSRYLEMRRQDAYRRASADITMQQTAHSLPSTYVHT